MLRFFIWSHIHTLSEYFRRKWQLYFFNRLYTAAHERIQMYKSLYDGETPDSCVSFSELEKIPTLHKKYVVATDETKRYATPLASVVGDWKHTSGSTGMPLHFPVDSFYAKNVKDKRYLAFSRYRFLCWRENVDFNRVLELVQRQRLYHIGFDAYSTQPHSYMFTALSDLREKPEATMQSLVDFAPTLIESLPTTLVQLAQLNKSQTVPVQCPYVYAIGEVLTETQRKIITDSFGAEVFNGYGMEEVGMIALECQCHNGLHISEESFLVEILDENNHQVPDGTEGRIVLTYFWNTVMPFIRYESGDIGMIIPGSCPCGISARKIVVKGRIGGVINYNGMSYSYLELARVLEDLHQYILQFQWVYDQELVLRVCYVPEITSSDIQKVVTHIADWLGFVPKIVETNNFQFQNGKVPAVVDISKAHT